MIRVDIVCPTGGLRGGVENVIKKWIKYIDHDKYDLRIFHCHEGLAYLEGYPKAYCVNKPFEVANRDYLEEAYTSFVQQMGAPDICIATNWPMMVLACANVKSRLNLSEMVLVSWIHNKISIYEKEGLGGTADVVTADCHFSISKGISEEIRMESPDAKIYEIYNPVDLPEAGDVEVDPYQLCYVGRLEEIKHVELILEAMSKSFGPWKLKIAGDGDCRNELKEWIRVYHLEPRVEMLGWCDEPWEEVKDASICIFASEYEGFALTSLEASAQGKTIISTPVNGVIDYIKDGENGYTYPFGDANALAEILDDLDEGKITICNPTECRNSVMFFQTQNYFERLIDILNSIYVKL